MEWLVRRLFSDGSVLPVAMRNAHSLRGRLLISQQDDAERHRRSMVARLLNGTATGSPVPPLWDVTLVSASDSLWVLTGHERVEAGPLRKEVYLVQTWWAEPAPLEDLSRAQAEWERLLRLVEELKRRGVEIPHVP